MGLGNLAPVICLKWIEPSNYPSFSLKLYVTLFENIKPADVHWRDFRCIYATYNTCSLQPLSNKLWTEPAIKVFLIVAYAAEQGMFINHVHCWAE